MLPSAGARRHRSTLTVASLQATFRPFAPARCAGASRKESDVNAFGPRFMGCVIALVASIAACKEREIVVEEASSDEVPDNDYFYLQRASRDGRVGLEARSRALIHARLLKA